MSPEQIEGTEADARTDIFSFGAMFFEMVTGQKAFDAKSAAGLLGAILKDQPLPVTSLQPLAPRALNRVVATCLAKDPDDRWQSARDLRRELQWIADGTADGGSSVVHDRPSRTWWMIGLAAGAAALAGIAIGVAMRPAPAAAPP